jgi:hypothetical protein
MFSKNSIIAGLLLGCIGPAVVWLVFELWLKNDSVIMDKPGAPYLITIAINLFLIKYTLKKQLDTAAKGVMITTFAVMVAVFVFKIHAG